jgi:hypothetical protein
MELYVHSPHAFMVWHLINHKDIICNYSTCDTSFVNCFDNSILHITGYMDCPLSSTVNRTHFRNWMFWSMGEKVSTQLGPTEELISIMDPVTDQSHQQLSCPAGLWSKV